MATLELAKIKPGTTPVLSAVVDGEAIQDATVYLTIEIGDRQITKSNYMNNEDMALEAVIENGVQVGTKVSVQYSQDETLFLKPGYAAVEVGWVFDDGAADKTNIGRIRIPRTLFREVMLYG